MWREGVYDEHGKWMDGWETRRRRDGGHDSCIVRLCVRAVVHGVDVDTAFFNGNQPVAATDRGVGRRSERRRRTRGWWIAGAGVAARAESPPPARERSPTGRARTCGSTSSPTAASRGCALTARSCCDWSRRDARRGCATSRAVENGGQAIVRQRPALRLDAQPAPARPRQGHGRRLGDAATPRSRQRLRACCASAVPARSSASSSTPRTSRATTPIAPSLRAAPRSRGVAERDIGRLASLARSETWPVLLEQQKLEADHVHVLEPSSAGGPVSHVRLEIYPDGGVSRLRLWGRFARASRGASPAPARGAMSGELREWLHLLLRWTHVVAGAFWIGQTAFFTWLDAQSRRAIDGAQAGERRRAGDPDEQRRLDGPQRRLLPGRARARPGARPAQAALVQVGGGGELGERHPAPQPRLLPRRRDGRGRLPGRGARRRRHRRRDHHVSAGRSTTRCGSRRSSAASRSAPRSRSLLLAAMAWGLPRR